MANEADGGLTSEQATAMRAKARAEYQDEGRIEIDDNAQLSVADPEDEPDGCYVQAWVWVYFDRADENDDEEGDEDDDCDDGV